MNDLYPKLERYAKVVARLFEGDMDYKHPLWDTLHQYQTEVQTYVQKIGLELVFMKTDGYAFLKQYPIDEKGNTIGLKNRRPIGFETSVVCVLVRELLLDFESNPTKTETEKILSHAELKESIEVFFHKHPNRKIFMKDLDKHIKSVVELGFLQRLDNLSPKISEETKYQIKKIIKSKITINDLNEFKQKLIHL